MKFYNYYNINAPRDILKRNSRQKATEALLNMSQTFV